MDLDFDDLASAPAARAGARFKPKGRPVPKKKQVSTQPKDSVSLDRSSTSSNKVLTSETIVPESRTLPEENVHVISREVNEYMNPSILRTCTKAVSEGGKCKDGIEVAPAIHDVIQTHTAATDGDVHAQSDRMQTEEGESHLDMETLDIIQEEGTTSSYGQHTGKLQPKHRVLETVIEEPESHCSVDDNGHYSMGTNESEPMVNVESRNDFDTNTTSYGVPEELNIPEVPRETVPEMETQNASGGLEHQEHVVSPSTNNTVEEERSGRVSKKGKSKKAAARKRKNSTEQEANKSKENQEKKKFKHSSRRENKRALEKELLETPDDEIRFLPIRDMLRLVEYKEWLEKKEAKGAPPVVQPTQESNTNTSQNQYYTQDFDVEDEFAMEEGENQEADVVKPDSPVNYQTYMNKTSRTRWTKEDTELFYEGIREFGSNLSMVQQLFSNRTREQIKLKFKLEERRHPLKMNDALSSRSKHLIHFPNVIKKLQQEAAAAKQAEQEDGEEEQDDTEDAGAETTNVPHNEETEQTGVKESDGGDLENGVKTDGGDECDNEGDDDDFWNSYKSDM